MSGGKSGLMKMQQDVNETYNGKQSFNGKTIDRYDKGFINEREQIISIYIQQVLEARIHLHFFIFGNAPVIKTIKMEILTKLLVFAVYKKEL